MDMEDPVWLKLGLAGPACHNPVSDREGGPRPRFCHICMSVTFVTALTLAELVGMAKAEPGLP